jgi:cytochrome c
MRKWLVLLLLLAGCETWSAGDPTPSARRLTGGEPARGPRAALRYGCGTCHQIPGVPGARSTVGPPLGGMATRAMLAGKYSNSPKNLIEWIRHPQSMQPGSAMPDMAVTEQDGKDLAAYLYTLD